MFSSENEFDSVIKEHWGTPVAYDGITDIAGWNAAKPKILWVLKEPNERSETPAAERDHRDFHTNVSAYYAAWRQTYAKLILSSYGILHKTPYADLPALNDDATMNGEYVLNSVAIININKNGGGAQADSARIEANYTKHKDILLQQIDGIAPDVIINSSRVFRLFEDVAAQHGLTKAQYKSGEYTINYASSDELLFIDYWHPNSRMETEFYCSTLIEIYQAWAKK